MRAKRISRRTVLRGAGGAAVALPFLELMGQREAYAQAFPKRLVIVYTPNGNVPSRFWPTGNENDFSLGETLAPLESVKNDLLIVKNVDLLSAMKGPGDAHQKGTGSILTGVPLQEGDFPGDGGLSAGWGDGVSIDQHIAAQLAAGTAYPSLEFGAMVAGSNVGSRISYRGPAQPLPPENSPYIGYERIFGDPNADDGAVERRAAQRMLVLDQVAGEYQRLSSRLGAADRQKLETHLLSVNDIKARLNADRIQFAGACQPLELGAPISVEQRTNLPAIGRLQMDLLTMSLACDVTRVATLMWTNSATKQVFSWLGSDITEGHHPIAHKGDDDLVAYDQLTRINVWYAEQFAYLVNKLKSVPEGDGTLLDNTVVLWVNEQMKGNTHDRDNMPIVMAGGAGGAIKTGRYFNAPVGSSTNQVYVNLMHAMGIDQDSFGDPDFDAGEIAGLAG